MRISQVVLVEIGVGLSIINKVNIKMGLFAL